MKIRPSVIEHNPKNLDELKIHSELSESARSSNGSANLEMAIRRLESRLDTMTVSSVTNPNLPTSNFDKARWSAPNRRQDSDDDDRYQGREQSRHWDRRGDRQMSSKRKKTKFGEIFE